MQTSPMSPFPTWTRRGWASSPRRSAVAEPPLPSPPSRDAPAALVWLESSLRGARRRSNPGNVDALRSLECFAITPPKDGRVSTPCRCQLRARSIRLGRRSASLARRIPRAAESLANLGINPAHSRSPKQDDRNEKTIVEDGEAADARMLCIWLRQLDRRLE